MSVDLLSRAQQIVTEVNESIHSGQDIIHTCDLGPGLPHLENNYAKFGHRWIQYSQYELHLEKVRLATTKALESLKGSIQFRISAQSLAVGMLNVGKCGEMAHAAVFKAGKICHSIRVHLTSDPMGRQLPNDDSQHSFVLMDVKDSQLRDIKTTRIIDILKQLKTGIILDPLLKVACPVSELQTKGQPLLTFIKKFNSHFLHHQVQVITPSDSPEKIFEEANKIAEKAREILPTIPATEISTITLNWLKTALTNRVAPKIITALQPYTSGKWNINTKEAILTLWTEVTKEEGDRLTSKLKDLAVNFKYGTTKEGKSIIKIENPNPDKFIEK